MASKCPSCSKHCIMIILKSYQTFQVIWCLRYHIVEDFASVLILVRCIILIIGEPNINIVNDDISAKLTNMTMIQLKNELKKWGFRRIGLKNELILRITAIVQLERELDKLEYYNNIKNKNNDSKNAHWGHWR